MKHKSSIINQPEITLMVFRAKSFPEGIKATWQNLENKLHSLRGRKFYGVTIPQDNNLLYYAGVMPQNEEEINSLSLPTIKIDAGQYVRVKLNNWKRLTGEIDEIVEHLIDKHQLDNDVITLEYYKSQTDMHLLHPLHNSWQLIR